jgi:hypothetical protein
MVRRGNNPIGLPLSTAPQKRPRSGSADLILDCVEDGSPQRKPDEQIWLNDDSDRVIA